MAHPLDVLDLLVPVEGDLQDVDPVEGDPLLDVAPECLANLLSNSTNKHATLAVLLLHKAQECNLLRRNPCLHQMSSLLPQHLPVLVLSNRRT